MIYLEAEGIALTMMPERGGKITSLFDTDHDREWLERSDHVLVGPADVEKSFDEGDMCGWDEMLPTISPCHYPGADLELLDHGELWRVAWDVTQQSSNAVSTRAQGHTLPYLFERTLTLDTRSLRVEYRVSTNGVDDLTFLWAAHPLFSLQPGTRMVVDSGSRSFDLLHDDGSRTLVSWPQIGVVISDVADVGLGQKFFARAQKEHVAVSLTDADGTRVNLGWRSSEIPWLGIWMDNCSLSRRPVAAIEATNGPDDSLEASTLAGQSWTVSPGFDRQWSVELNTCGVRT